MFTTVVSDYLKEVVKEYDEAMKLLSSENITVDMLTNSEARLSACYKRIEYFHDEICRLSTLRVNSPEKCNLYKYSAENILKVKHRLASCIIQLKTTQEEITNNTPYEASLCYNEKCGRPRFLIEKDQLLFLREYGFQWKRIASLLDVSRSSIYRRRQEYGLTNTAEYVSDERLDAIILDIKTRNCQWGAIMLEGYLKSQRLTVPRARILLSMARVDPLYTAQIWTAPIERRRYRVPSPGSLWHIDGNHKLVRYGIYIHGGIDGFSRVITFLQASSNNSNDTVLDVFLKATREHHLPSRIRTDHGTENVQIGEHMISNRPDGHNAWLKGSSVHNQRIERLWQDVRYAVLNYWRNFFAKLEDDGLLDINKRNYLTALHYVYLQEINVHLQQFIQSWNNHKLRTENQKTPWQLYISGLLERFGSRYTSVNDIIDTDGAIDYHFGVDATLDDLQIAENEAFGENNAALNVPSQLLEILERRVPKNTNLTQLQRYRWSKRACERFFSSQNP